MVFATLLYVSRSLLPRATSEADVEEIVRSAAVKNARLGISGALLFTGKYFAQQLEAEEQTLNQMMNQIISDARHGDVNVVDRRVPGKPRFEGWRMAYSGPSLFLDRHVAGLFAAYSPEEQERSSEWLSRFMLEFISS